MSVSSYRASRGLRAFASFAAMALVFAASCGRDITDNAPSTRGSVRLSTKAFQTAPTNSSGNGGDVSFVRVVISATNGTASSVRVLTNTVIEADTVGNGSSGNETDSTAGSVTISFPIQGAGVTYQVTLAAVDASGDTTYRGGPATFTSTDVSAAGAVTVTLQANYVGPGANAVRVVASPHTLNLVANSNSNQGQLTATAYDASGAALPQALFEWNSSDTTIANVDGNLGTVFAAGKRGSTTITVTAQGAVRPTDAVTVNVSLPAQSMTIVSGGGQSGPIGKPLANPVIVKAVASDGVPVAGVTINFQAQGSGSVSPSSMVTGASGTAQTSWTLGSVVGNQNLSASIPNSPASITVSATGTGSPTGGNGSAQLTLLSNNSVLAAHGTSNIVTVLYQNNGTPIQGGFVAFTPGSSASGSVSASTVTTDASGHASVNWTLGTAPSESLIISAANASSVTLQATVSAASSSARPISP